MSTVAAMVLLPVALLVWWLLGHGESRRSQDPAAVRLCAHVITDEPAPVYPRPDVHTKPIKYKYKTDRVEILDRQHPAEEWLVVKTPADPPGANWMQAAALTAPAPCPSPAPGAH